MTPAVGYTEMKDSGTKWLGWIPDHWKLSKIGSLYSLRNEKVSDKDYPPLSVTMKGILPQLATAAKTDDGDNRKLVRAGDFVINSRSDRRGSCGISPYDGSVSLINTILTPRGRMHPDYYNWLFHTSLFADEFYKWGHGIVDDLWTTRWQEMKRILVAVPPYEEQTAIAAYLDSQCAKIDEIIAEAKASIEDYKQWKASIIYEAVTKGLDPNAEMKDSGIEWIGEIPKEWLVTKMRKVASFYNGDRTSRYPKPDDFVVAGVPFINSTNLNGDTLNMTSCKYITEEKYNSLSGTKLRPNDIVYCLRGSVGKCAINTTLQRGTVASSLMSIRAERINPYFLLFVLLSDVISRQTGVYINGTCAANLSAENVGGFAVPFPPAQEQGQIAECLMRKGAMIDELIADKSKFIANLDTYKKSLIYEVVTGKRRVC